MNRSSNGLKNEIQTISAAFLDSLGQGVLHVQPLSKSLKNPSIDKAC